LAFIGKAVKYFASLNLNCPINYNPADFFIQQLAVMPGKEAQCKEKLKVSTAQVHDSILSFDSVTK